MAKSQQFKTMNTWIYDSILWAFSILVDLFFREVHPRGSWKIPRRGPVLFVAAPHANQFVDSLIMMRTIWIEAHRRVSFLIAEKSMRLRFIGLVARLVGSVSVARAMDSTRPATGKIYLPDPQNDPSLVRGIGTKFDSSEVQIGGLLVLPAVNGSTASGEVEEVLGPEELRLKKVFKGAIAMKQLTGRDDIDEDGKLANGNEFFQQGPSQGYQGSTFKTAPKIDQSKVYDTVFQALNSGGCIGIFPEGGSHDRTELLPLKPGVAIMALGAVAASPDCDVKIVPCGMNYFHAHKFRSRAVIEFGHPLEVPPELVELYKKGDRREAVRRLLETIYQALVAVTVTSPDYDTLMLIQAARRLYNPTGKKLPLPMVVELNRRLVKGYTQYKDDPRMVSLKVSVNDYNNQLRLLGLRDYQVEYAKFSIPKVVFTLIYRVGKLSVMAIGTLPGLVLFAPVFIATKIISIKKSREALAASSVKVQGRDVMATWKLLVALAFAPLLYAFYIVLLTWWTYRNRVQGTIPGWVPLWAVVVFGMGFFPAITFAALRIGETGMDILKSLRPLVLCLRPTAANTFVRLREKRAQLSTEVTALINTLGPEMYPDFDSARIVADPFHEEASPSSASSRLPREAVDRSGGDERSHREEHDMKDVPSAHGHLPRNESFGNLGSIGLFATRPPSRSRSRSNSSGGPVGADGFPLKGFSTLSSKAGFDEVSQKIRGAMVERGKLRSKRRSEVDSSWDMADDSDATTHASEEGKKTI